MKIDVIKLDGKKAGSVELVDDVFGLEPRADILQRVVRWQRNGSQAGTHKVKTRREVSYSTKKIYRQRVLSIMNVTSISALSSLRAASE